MKCNPLHEVDSDYTWKDYDAFKQLQLPSAYLHILFKNFKPKTMANAISKIGVLIDKTNDYIWSKQVNPSITERLYRCANIPPQYATPSVFDCNTVEQQKTVDTIIDKADWLLHNGKTFYFHGLFADQPMKAAVEILKSILHKVGGPMNIPCYCDNFGSFMSKVFNKGDTDKYYTTPVLLLWGVGIGTSSEFHSSKLKELIETREMTGLTTILVANCTEAEFKTKYAMDVPGIAIGFKGVKPVATLKQLREEMLKHG